ncbi:DUF1697 domain-containing protein [Brachybacterium hainanense]|uniref:DUF1697 domain-containing protein n=1 Tax=Brachybacterium hainanense TaxID=1541174 RepID=A0ABV6R7K2_9MICO
MTRWIALLRGINVGGVSIRSAELAALFRELGFAEVRTVLASGNVVFETDAGQPAALKARIEQALSERFGYEAWIVLLRHADLAAIVAGYPFAEDAEHHAYVIFSSAASSLDELLEGTDPADATDPVAAGEGVLYWRGTKGTSTTTPFARRLAAARFRSTTTNRNIRTLRRML